MVTDGLRSSRRGLRGRSRTWAGRVEPNEVADAVRRAAAGDKTAWNLLVDRFSRMLWNIAIGHRLGPADAAEVVQTTWMRLLEHLDRITYPERLGGWLATTARRESLRLLRLRARESLRGDESALESGVEADTFASPEMIALGRERDRLLWVAFARLSESCQSLLRLVVVVAPTYAEVAQALDMPIGSIGPTRARCLERLRRLLSEQGGGHDLAR